MKFWVVFLQLSLAISMGLSATGIDVIPTPREVVFDEGNFCLNRPGVLYLSLDRDFSPPGAGIVLLQEALRDDWGIDSMLVRKQGDFPSPYTLVLGTDVLPEIPGEYPFSQEMLKEGYFLRISPDRIAIVARSERGLFYGIASLVQLLEDSPERCLKCLYIRDYPALEWRGVSDDISRGQVSTMTNFKKIIRFLGLHKMNVYMPYLEDMIQLKRYPDIGRGRGALSKQELRELQTYADQYHVEVIPIFQTLGHYENILNMPAYVRLAEYPGAASLNILSEDAEKFLANLLDEVVPLFDSDYFHIGADESWDVGRGATREIALKEGVAAVHALHYNRVYAKVRSHGKRPLMYGDIILRHPEILQQIPKDIIIVDWHYWPMDIYPSVSTFQDSGFDVIVSPGIHNWNDLIPNFTSSWINIANINRLGYRFGALGSITSNWGDYGGPNFRELNYLGYIYGSETGWNPADAEEYETNRKFFQKFFGTDDARLFSILYHLNEIGYLTSFKDVWRCPFHEIDENPGVILVRSRRLLHHSRVAITLIEEVRPIVTKGDSYFDYFKFGARLGQYVAERNALARSIARLHALPEVDPLSIADLVRACDELIATILALEEEYRHLWLRTNRPDNLPRIINLFRHQSTYLQAARDQLETGNISVSGDLTSEWITNSADSLVSAGKPLYFRKSFRLGQLERTARADLQLIANSWARISINETEVGAVKAVKSLSLWVENQRVGWWKVGKYLQSGENVISVEAADFRDDRPTAVNVLLEITYRDGNTYQVLSDSTWRVSEIVTRSGEQTQARGNEWKPAETWTGAPWRISPPLFKHGFSSRIEF